MRRYSKSLSWASKHDDIGTVTAYNINNSTLENQSKQNNHIATNRHFWGYVITKTVWDEIKHIIYQFEAKYLTKSSYTNRAHRRIRWLFMAKWINKKRMIKSKNLVPEHCQTPPFPRIPFQIATSQCNYCISTFGTTDTTESQARVSRAEYIGVEGYSFSQFTIHKASILKNLADYTQIQTPQEFVLVDTDDQGKPIKPTPYR